MTASRETTATEVTDQPTTQVPVAGRPRLLELHDSLIQVRALQIAAELRLTDELSAGPCTAEDLAKRTNTHPGALHRLLRLLACCDVVTEVAPGRFALRPLGAQLSEDHPESVYALMVSGERWFSRVMAHALHSVRTGSAAFPQTFGEPLYSYLERHPEEGALFTSMMASASRGHARAVTAAYDFSEAEVIVDIGGGEGTLLSSILDAFPKVKGVLLDRPGVVDVAGAHIAAKGLADRCATVAGDFHQGIPPGGDLYLLKWILHNWPEEQALGILRVCRRAMSPQSRLLVIEAVVPPGDSPHPSKVMDFTMLVLLQGQERTSREYEALLAEAGFHLTRILGTTSPLSVIEAVPIPTS